MTLISVIVVSALTLLAWKINRRTPGLRLFALGLLSLSVGAILGLARLLVAGNLIVAACNLLMVAGMFLMAQGIRAFRGFPLLRPAAIMFMVAPVAMAYFYWMFGRDSFGMRVAVISASYALLSLDAAHSMARRVPARDRLIYWPTAAAFGFAAAYLTVRAAGAFSGRYGPGMLSPVPLELASTICANISYILCSFGMLLASNAQLRIEAERMAHFDHLTDLPNRRLLLDRLLSAEFEGLASGKTFGLIYLDLDDFKIVNDTLGHAAGDDLLRTVGKSMSTVLAQTLRPGLFLARVGGDEFVVLVEEPGGHEPIDKIAGLLRNAVEREAAVRLSYGIALFPSDGNSAHDLMRLADAAMYRSKRQKLVLSGN